MRESTEPLVSLPAVSSRDVLTGILWEGAQRLLTQAIEAEVAECAGGALDAPESGRSTLAEVIAIKRIAASGRF